jgi:hypothetical protein
LFAAYFSLRNRLVEVMLGAYCGLFLLAYFSAPVSSTRRQSACNEPQKSVTKTNIQGATESANFPRGRVSIR